MDVLSYTSRKLCASSLSSQGVSLVLNMQLNWSNWVSKKNSVIMMHGILCSSSSSTRTQNQSNPKTHLMVTEVERTFKSNFDSEAERIQNHKLLCSQIQQFQFCSHSVVLLSVLVPVIKFSSRYNRTLHCKSGPNDVDYIDYSCHSLLSITPLCSH